MAFPFYFSKPTYKTDSRQGPGNYKRIEIKIISKANIRTKIINMSVNRKLLST